MDGNFEEYKPGFYTVEFSQADDFRNKDKSPADLAKWGTAYAVKFKGDAGTYYWSSRTEPQEDQRVYGHVEPSKSGKSMNFRRDEDPNKGAEVQKQQPTDGFKPKSDKPYLRDVTTIPLDVWRALLNVQGVPENPTQFQSFFETVRTHTEELLSMIDNVRAEPVKEAPKPLDQQSLGNQFRNRNNDEMSTGEPDLPAGW